MIAISRAKNKLRRIKNQFIRRKPPEALILMYHRIGQVPYDPWDLCVSKAHFEEHLQVLARDYEVHPLSQLKGMLLQKDKRRKKIFITFDDGYVDNLESAIPLLNKWSIPATFFIPTQIISEQDHFWWEVVDYIFGSGMKFPEQFHLHSGDNDFIRILPEEAQIPDPGIENKWSANTMNPPTERCHFYLDLCEWIKRRTAGEQTRIVGRLMEQFNLSEDQDIGFRKMSPEQIRLLPDQGFEVGAHTVHHPALIYQSVAIQQQEIFVSKDQLEQLIGTRVHAFAYPHGDYNQQVRDLVCKAGFTLACTTENKGIYNSADLFTLPRAWVYDWSANELKQKLDYFFNS
jgi:peptidoglycan/xylan/chitin deacetylase (PgdA/CDA1 family)